MSGGGSGLCPILSGRIQRHIFNRRLKLEGLNRCNSMARGNIGLGESSAAVGPLSRMTAWLRRCLGLELKEGLDWGLKCQQRLEPVSKGQYSRIERGQR